MDTSAKAHFAFVGFDETSKYKPDKIVVKNELAHDGPKSNQIKFPDDAGDILKIHLLTRTYSSQFLKTESTSVML